MVAQQFHLSQALIEAVIHEESGGDPDAFPEHPERAGASFGLMQLLLPTARAVGFGGKARELFGPALNITLGSRYLHGLVKEYGNYWRALVAYNGGSRAVWRVVHHLPGGPAVHFADTVMSLLVRYTERNHARLHADLHC